MYMFGCAVNIALAGSFIFLFIYILRRERGEVGLGIHHQRHRRRHLVGEKVHGSTPIFLFLYCFICWLVSGNRYVKYLYIYCERSE